MHWHTHHHLIPQARFYQTKSSFSSNNTGRPDVNIRESTKVACIFNQRAPFHFGIVTPTYGVLFVVCNKLRRSVQSDPESGPCADCFPIQGVVANWRERGGPLATCKHNCDWLGDHFRWSQRNCLLRIYVQGQIDLPCHDTIETLNLALPTPDSTLRALKKDLG